MKITNLKDLGVIALIIVGLFGVWGGVLNYARRMEKYNRLKKRQKVFLFGIDLISSTGLALLTHILLQGVGVPETISVAIAGYIAYRGTQAVYILQLLIAEKVGSKELIKLAKDELEQQKPTNKKEENSEFRDS
ncbi:MAG: hypothetical protein C6I01_01920 [Epsilonproteobacteria bacterium]|nr:hypothetical protein [Campylobacterota bacterium]